MFDLWDVESRKYFGSFASEEAALRLVESWLDSNGEDYAGVLELGATDDETGARNLTDAALVHRVRARSALAEAGAGHGGSLD